MIRRVFVGALLLLLSPTLAAQQPTITEASSRDNVHFAFATLLGTGIYQLDDRTVTIFRVPISWSFREPTREEFGIKLKVPIAIGLHNYDLLEDLIPVADQLSTLSVVPGLELEFLAGENWRVKPVGYLGFGTDLSRTDSALIYGAGISALRPLNFASPDMTFGAALLLNGYDPGSRSGDFISRWSAGVDAKWLTRWNIDNRDVFIGGHVIGYYYMNQLEFQTIIDEPIKLRAEIEFGIFVGARPSPKIFGITINRLGIGYRFSDVSDAVVLFAGFPF